MSAPAYSRIATASLALVLISGCRQAPPEVRSLLSFPEIWESLKKESPYFCERAHQIAARTDSLRQKEISQFLARYKINDLSALLEYESSGWNFKGIYTVIVITKHSAYQIRFFDQGRELKRLRISEEEMAKNCQIVTALDRYEGERLHGACDIGIIFMTTYKNRHPSTMFVQYGPMPDKRQAQRKGTPQEQAFYLLYESLLLAEKDGLADEKTDAKYFFDNRPNRLGEPEHR